MRKRNVEDVINEKIEKSVDIDFNYSEIKNDIDFSAYRAPDIAPKEKRKLPFALVGSLAAVAVAITIIIPVAVSFFGAGSGKSYDMANNAAYDTDNLESGTVGQGQAMLPGGVEKTDDADGAANYGAASGEKTQSGAGYEDVSWSHNTKQVEGTYRITDGVAKVVTDTGDTYELDKNVKYLSADGSYDTDKTCFADGDRVIAYVATESNADSDNAPVKANEVVTVKKID